MTAIDDALFTELRASLDGDVVAPDDPVYEEARKVFNGMIDKHPAAIARCAGPADVATAIKLACDRGVPLAVRCGGHSVAGLGICDGGIVIDLCSMKSIEVDCEAGIARAGGGVLWGEFDQATQAHALATPGGRMTTTGLGGFTLGGGYGWLSDKYGLASDNLIAADVVTADGQLLTASETENEDLLWGLRGGGGNFGVVTSYTFRLHQLGPILLAGLALWPIERAPDVIRAWRDYVDDAPDEVSSACVLLTAPPAPFVPSHLQGRLCLGMSVCYIGDPEKGARVIRPLTDLTPDLNMIQPMPYTAFQAMLDPNSPAGFRNYWRGQNMTALSDEAIEVFLERATTPISPLSMMILFRLGGALSRVGENDTAFSHRDTRYMFHPISLWAAPAEDEHQIAWTREFTNAMRPFTTGSVYLNFVPELEEQVTRTGFRDTKFERLAALKAKYDPHNLFRLNNNIRPTAPAGVHAKE